MVIDPWDFRTTAKNGCFTVIRARIIIDLARVRIIIGLARAKIIIDLADHIITADQITTIGSKFTRAIVGPGSIVWAKQFNFVEAGIAG